MRASARSVIPRLLGAAACALHLAASAAPGAADGKAPQGTPAARAQFGQAVASSEARTVGDWVVRARDNGKLPFMIIDKPRARLHVFDASGRLHGSAPVLLGIFKGDHTAPGVGDKPLSEIPVHERTTPAGRFVAERGRNLKGDPIIWVDYDAAVSMHRVRSVGPGEKRLERLASKTADDNRISYGCINVPVAFFDTVIDRVVTGPQVMVYVLPDEEPLHRVFGWQTAVREGAVKR